jgi:hypothetical protein
VTLTVCTTFGTARCHIDHRSREPSYLAAVVEIDLPGRPILLSGVVGMDVSGRPHPSSHTPGPSKSISLTFGPSTSVASAFLPDILLTVLQRELTSQPHLQICLSLPLGTRYSHLQYRPTILSDGYIDNSAPPTLSTSIMLPFHPRPYTSTIVQALSKVG